MRLASALFAVLLVGCGSAPKPAAPATTPSPFVATAVEGLGEPEVIVENASDRPFTIVLTGKNINEKLSIPPHEKRSLRVPPGIYGYEASAPDILPAKGEQAFAQDVRYAWKFVILTKSADSPEFAGMGWHCFEVMGKPAYLVCTRHKTQCEKARAEPGPPDEPPLSPCAELKVVYGFTDEAKNFTVSARTMEICEQLRPTYLKQATDPAKVTPCRERP